MKKLLMTASLLAVAVSPALARESHKMEKPDAISAYQDRALASTLDAQTVVTNGQVLGRDPDPAVRLDLLRQADSLWNSN